MVDVEFGANEKLCRTLGIKKLPYIHFYRGKKGKVTDFLCTPKDFQLLIDKIEEHREEKNNKVLERVLLKSKLKGRERKLA